MKILAIIGVISALLASGCKRKMNAGLAGKEQNAFEVRATQERIIFRGLDDPKLTAERPDDVYVENVKAGRYNGSVQQRCTDEAECAMAMLRPVVISADTNVLIRSLRSGYDNDVGRWVSLYGNLAIGEELVKREPIPASLHPPPNEWGYFTGDSGPPAFTLEDFLEYVRRRFPALNGAKEKMRKSEQVVAPNSP